MSVINQVLRDLDARGAAVDPQRCKPWSPDAGQPAPQARFFADAAEQAQRTRRHSAWRGDGLWRLPISSVLVGVLGVMLLGGPWLSTLMAPRQLADTAALAPVVTAAHKPSRVPGPPSAATAARPLTQTQGLSATPGRTAPAKAAAIEDLPPPAAGRMQVAPRRSDSISTNTVARLTATSTAAPPSPDLGSAAPSLPTAALGLASVEKTLSPVSPAQRAQASYALAVESTQSGRSMMALTQTQEALRHQPAHHPARHLAAVLLHETARTDLAVDLLREGLNLDPKADTLSLLLARLQAHQGTLEAALQTLDQGQLLTLEAETLRAGLWSQLRNHKQAASAYEAALKMQPGQATLWLGWGVALEGDGQGGAARQAFARAQATGLPDPELSAFVAQRLKALE